MKKYFYLLLFIFSFYFSNSQAVFCPKGASWHYTFTVPLFYYHYENESISYIADSIVGQDTLKILSHTRFYLSCNDFIVLPYKTTYIKQKGDTVFFKNIRTLNTWQILFNFACTPGQSWTTTVMQPYSTTTATTTYTLKVDSVKTVNINGFNLKQLFINGLSLTERIGWQNFLFRYNGNNGCDGDYWPTILCYQDNAFGLKQFSDKSCYFQGVDDIVKTQNDPLITIYPNPAFDLIYINNVNNITDIKITLTDVFGNAVLIINTNEINSEPINIQNLAPGIYFLQVSKNEVLQSNQKIIKY